MLRQLPLMCQHVSAPLRDKGDDTSAKICPFRLSSISFEIVYLESIKCRRLLGGKRSIARYLLQLYIPVNPIYQPNVIGRARRRITSVINTRESLWETKRMSWWWSGAIGAAKASDFNPFSVQFSVVSAFSLFGLGK